MQDQPDGVACGMPLMTQCRAQHCAGRFVDVLGLPFCADCRALLPTLVLRRFEEQWESRPMVEIEEEEWRHFIGARSGERLQIPTGRIKKRMVHDIDTLAAHVRRVEVTAAWTLRRIRRHGGREATTK